MMDTYESKRLLGAMVRDAARAAVHNTDGPNDPDLQRLNNILVCEAFVNALVDKGCMIQRIPTRAISEDFHMSDEPGLLDDLGVDRGGPPPIPFVPADPAACTCVDPWSNCPTHG
jgi:hypothetical protein